MATTKHTQQGHFGRGLFRFLSDLKAHNDRDWFAANKGRYERDVRDPLLAFIRDVAAPLARVSREVVADPRPVGGSLFRIYRDVRFAKDKSPFKTHAAAQFRHRAGKDVHVPGFYLHLEPGAVLAGGGLWRPEAPALLAVRTAIASKPADWKRVVNGAAFRRTCELGGESAKRPPRGFDPDHPLIDFILRKDFVALHQFSEKDAQAPGFLQRFVGVCRAVSPLNAFLCKALGQSW
jgi:uncharacterized protein (TIGR02453 family)